MESRGKWSQAWYYFLRDSKDDGLRLYVHELSVRDGPGDRKFRRFKPGKELAEGVVALSEKKPIQPCLTGAAIHSEEGQVCRNTVWLRERNDALACRLFVEYMETKRLELLRQAEDLEQRIRRLEKMMESNND